MFSVNDKHGHTRWFEETFLIADINQDIVLGMPFLTLANPDIHFAEGSLLWRDYSVQTAFPTERRIELVEPEIFADEALNVNAMCFVVYVAACFSHVNPARAIKIGAISVKDSIGLPSEYSEYARVFSPEEANKLPEHTKDDHHIILEEDKSPPHGPIYPLGEPELEVLRSYIETNLANGFIRP